MQQQEIVQEIKVGDYVSVYSNSVKVYGTVTNIDRDGDFLVIREDGIGDLWLKSQTTYEDAAQVIQRFIIIPQFTSAYDAVIDFEEKVFRVGCQLIPFEVVNRIANIINSKP